MFNLFRSKEDIEISALIEKSLIEDYKSWIVDDYNARRGSLKIWIANSSYADMTVNGQRLANRGRLRRALFTCVMKQATDDLNKK